MAQDNKIRLPSGQGGLTRYFDEYKSRIEFSPAAVVVMVVVVIIIIIFLHQFAALEYEAVSVADLGTGRGDVAHGRDSGLGARARDDFAVFKNGLGGAKDEVDTAANVAVFKVAAGAVEEECVLVAGQFYIAEECAVGTLGGHQRDGLCFAFVGRVFGVFAVVGGVVEAVFDRHIERDKIIGANNHGAAAACAPVAAARFGES